LINTYTSKLLLLDTFPQHIRSILFPNINFLRQCNHRITKFDLNFEVLCHFNVSAKPKARLTSSNYRWFFPLSSATYFFGHRDSKLLLLCCCSISGACMATTRYICSICSRMHVCAACDWYITNKFIDDKKPTKYIGQFFIWHKINWNHWHAIATDIKREIPTCRSQHSINSNISQVTRKNFVLKIARFCQRV
jgi:hypothetical protein